VSGQPGRISKRFARSSSWKRGATGFCFSEKRKLFVPTSGTTIQRALEAQSKFAQLLTLEVKVESEIGEVEGNAFVDNVDFWRHGVASELRISYLQELSKMKIDRKLAQDKSIFYWAFLSTTKRNRRFGDKAKEKLRDCRKRLFYDHGMINRQE
jgi:hypothetical protein